MFFVTVICYSLIIIVISEKRKQFGQLKQCKKSNKVAYKGKNDDSCEKIIHSTKNKLEKLLENMVKKATKPLEDEIKELKTKLNEMVEGQNFISDKYDEMF